MSKKVGDPLDAIGETRVLDGYYARRDFFGRLIFDLCPTDKTHLTDPVAPGEQGRCLVHLGQLIPDSALNRKGTWHITVVFTPDEAKS